MKKVFKILSIILLFLFIVIEIFLQNKVKAKVNIQEYNQSYQTLLNDEKSRTIQIYHSYIYFAIQLELIKSDVFISDLIKHSMEFDYYINYQKLSLGERKKPSVLVRETWVTSYINFYLLNNREREKIYQLLLAKDYGSLTSPVN